MPRIQCCIYAARIIKGPDNHPCEIHEYFGPYSSLDTAEIGERLYHKKHGKSVVFTEICPLTPPSDL